MSTIPDTMTTEVLHTSLAANGLPISGSREQMYHRLLNAGEKKKPGPKPGSKNKVRCIPRIEYTYVTPSHVCARPRTGEREGRRD